MDVTEIASLVLQDGCSTASEHPLHGQPFKQDPCPARCEGGALAQDDDFLIS